MNRLRGVQQRRRRRLRDYYAGRNAFSAPVDGTIATHVDMLERCASPLMACLNPDASAKHYPLESAASKYRGEMLLR
jgi:hypothetical protein